MKCLSCGYVNDLDAEFCQNCGSIMAQFCKQCGAELKAGARFCKKCGAPAGSGSTADRLAALQQVAPLELKEKMRLAARHGEGERKPVTILFTDIVGSTAMAENLDPEVWKEIVSGVHQRVSQAVYRYEGTIAQLLGDGVLAFFGAPVTHEDDPLRAVLAALDIQRSMVDYERQLQGYIERFQMRIGLNSGTVVVGSVGSDLHMEYLAIGDAVNLAARLQSAAQPGKVLISESTASLVAAAFSLIPLGEITVKGKREPVKVFEVDESRLSAESRRGYAELCSPLVGREAELVVFQGALQQLSAGLGGIVSVIGEVGIGKSRLVEEACLRSAQGSPHQARAVCQSLRWLEGRALSYGQKLSFWTIRQLLQNDLGLSDGDPELKMRLALRKRVDALFRAQAHTALPYLASLLGVQVEGEMAESLRILDGETLKFQTLLTISRYFTHLAEEQPTVLVFDDLHWTDPSSLEALEQLFQLTDRVPLLLVLLSRLEREHPSWLLKLKASSQYAHRFSEIALQPLSGVEQNQLVDNLLAVADLPESARRRILERAEGNPLFLEEILRNLVEQGAIQREGVNWRAKDDILDIAIPETLRGVLLARIDRLQEDVRQTLQLASVIGKSFLYRLLQAIGEAETQLEGHLAQLQRADLVREKTRLPELEYTFKHSLAQEAAYHSLLIERRREFHRQVGTALEDLFSDRKEEYYGLLAHHFDAAGEKSKALGYLTKAGDKARLTDEHTEAVGFYRRAIELLSEIHDNESCTGLWFKLGLVYYANFQFEQAYQAYEHAFALQQITKSPLQVGSTPQGSTLRIYAPSIRWDCYDPGKAVNSSEGYVIDMLFSGLARVDAELNVLPDVARSWQVLDGGRRFIFHLRQDVFWTDGTLVTAHDFEWTWKRNLDPSFGALSAQFLYDIVGARDFHLGYHSNPDHIGVCALDDLTLEVNLVRPVAYFPYIMALTISFPIPSKVVEKYGGDWWLPERMVSNGAFRFESYTPGICGTVIRNPAFHGDFPGNIYQIEWDGTENEQERLGAYQENRKDIVLFIKSSSHIETSPEEWIENNTLSVEGILTNPQIPPLNDVRLRQALSLAFDREVLREKFKLMPALGGLIPPGMPGHSPDIGLRYDPEKARRLLAEAGYPDGDGFPVLKGIVAPSYREHFSQFCAQCHEVLGIRVDIEITDKPSEYLHPYHLVVMGWIADHPDPANFLVQSNLINHLRRIGWRDLKYETLVETAASLPERNRRMALYRQADRLAVAEQVVVIPVFYGLGGPITLVKPWVKNYKTNLLGRDMIREIIIEAH